jgi:hypothetical protein
MRCMFLFFFAHFMSEQKAIHIYACFRNITLFFYIDLWVSRQGMCFVCSLIINNFPWFEVLGRHQELDHTIIITRFQSFKQSMSTQQCWKVVGFVFRKMGPFKSNKPLLLSLLHCCFIQQVWKSFLCWGLYYIQIFCSFLTLLLIFCCYLILCFFAFWKIIL